MENLREFFENVYSTNPYLALIKLSYRPFLAERGWHCVFHEGLGAGVWSPDEGIVAVFDEDDLDTYHEFSFYKYNPDAWVTADTEVQWAMVYAGRNGGDYPVELAD